MFKIGDVFFPKSIRTGAGCCQIYHIQEVPESRRGMYSEDGSVDKLYHVYTDFGNKLTLTGKELKEEFHLIGNEDVRERLEVWKNNVLRVVGEIVGGE